MLPFELECDGHDRTRGLAVRFLTGFAIALDAGDPRIGEDRNV